MPAFQAHSVTGKRKSDVEELESRKRPTLDSGRAQYWMVQWRNHQTKKHKTWEGDGVLVAEGGKGTLYDSDGRVLGKGTLPSPIEDGFECQFGGKDIGVDCETTKSEFLSGRCFGTASLSIPAPSAGTSSSTTRTFTPLRNRMTSNPSAAYRPPTTARKPILLQEVGLLSSPQTTSASEQSKENISDKSYWSANWRPVSKRGKGPWDGDAFVIHEGKKATLISEKGKILSTSASKANGVSSDTVLYFGAKEVKLFQQVKLSDLPIDAAEDDPIDIDAPEVVDEKPEPSAKKFVTPVNGLAASSFYNRGVAKKHIGPLHDPNVEGAIVMKSPTDEHQRRWNKGGRPVVPVVLDPIIAQKLRPHQIEGVRFMYECIMGLRKHEGLGCILADEMGLGKTLQTITLIWTLLKQNPYGGAGPVMQKVLIVCPVSLINNWKLEFNKWLGKDRVGVTVCDKDTTKIKQFVSTRPQHVLIIGYERLRMVVKQLKDCVPPIGLIICDEGHRLKSANNKTTAMFSVLKTMRRIILSGTPIQNDLGEFHAMADFCNPGLLDDYASFKRNYENPILKSREPGCSRKENEVGEARSAQLLTVSKSFVLRRDAAILGNYLPPKHEYVVFITPTSLQLSIFAKVLRADKLDDLVHGSTAESLALINLLTKVSNSPILLKAIVDKANAEGKQSLKHDTIREAMSLIPEGARVEDMSLSGKLTVLDRLLARIKETTEEKCVLVSNYTSTLNILEAYCKKRHYSYCRLDGSTPPAKRQEYVNLFNKTSQTSNFIFLLSSKAGGVGINLIGGSRLCLIDSDWNPSHDLQAMARCHRDGQKRPVFIYRFLTAGAIDEKIFQRQVTKLGLSDSLMSSTKQSSKSDAFTRKDLRDIFRIQPDTACNTHEILECPCDRQTSQPQEQHEDDHFSDASDTEQSGFTVASQVNPKKMNKLDKAYLKKKKESLASLGEWKHINCLLSATHDGIRDEILSEVLFAGEKTVAKGTKLLDALDLNNVTALSGVRTVRDVPGGSVSFLFERSSEDKATLPPIIDEEDKDEVDEREDSDDVMEIVDNSEIDDSVIDDSDLFP